MSEWAARLNERGDERVAITEIPISRISKSSCNGSKTNETESKEWEQKKSMTSKKTKTN